MIAADPPRERRNRHWDDQRETQRPAGKGDVGYWLGKPYWGKGIMREALTAVLDLCFGEFDQVKVEAEIFTTNSRSVALVEGLGMQPRGNDPLVSPQAWRMGRRTRLRDPPRRVGCLEVFLMDL